MHDTTLAENNFGKVDVILVGDPGNEGDFGSLFDAVLSHD